MYLNMLFYLKDRPELQRECGFNLFSRDPFMLALEKDHKMEGKGGPRRCYSACSIGQKCLKYKENEERMEDLVAPFESWEEGGQGRHLKSLVNTTQETVPLSPPSSLELERGRTCPIEPKAERKSRYRHPSASPPPRTHLQGLGGKSASFWETVIQAPLWEAAGPMGPMKIKVPLSLAD